MSSSLKTKRERRLTERFATGKDGLAIPRELTKVYKELMRHGWVKFPLSVTKSLAKDPQIDPTWSIDRLGDLAGDVLLSLFDSLGPIYGKAGQMALSRMNPKMQRVAEAVRLTRLYGDWPPIPFAEVEKILDEEIPSWHAELRVRTYPIGVASMAQVHVAMDNQGREWVIKIIKPNARKRLLETLGALEQAMLVARPIAVTAAGRRMLRELGELITALKREVDLLAEKRTIDRARENLKKRRQQALRIPETLDQFSTANVLTMERFEGVSLAELVSHKVSLPPAARRKLARKMLGELLVQIFEDGLFHADPHAGNLILLEGGSIGLFDWGLAGELLESDRRHIAAILKAIMAMDVDKLVEALADLAAEAGQNVAKKALKTELGRVARLIQRRSDAGKKPALSELMETSLESAEKLGIPVPDGLLMMAKSLLTIEGLARGIDPDVKLGRIATPVLFRAAKPGFKDLMALSLNMPKMARRLLAK